MSYDVSLVTTDALGGRHEVFWRNHTSNTAVMWREAGCDLATFQGAKASDLAQSLRPAVGDIATRIRHYSQWNPENGWGSVASTLAFLAATLDACDRFPEATVEVSR